MGTTKDTKRSGWPPGLLQDDSRELSRWFSTRLTARQDVRKAMEQKKQASNPPDPDDEMDDSDQEPYETSRNAAYPPKSLYEGMKFWYSVKPLQRKY